MNTTMKQSDITPEMIIATAERLGISLKPGQFRNESEGCGCPIAVLAIDLDSSLYKWASTSSYVATVERAGISYEFILGVVGGFDGNPPAYPDNDDCLAGHAIGHATRIKVDPVFAEANR